MDTSQPENIFENVQAVISDLPVPIRTFLTDGSVENAAQTITQKNHLHADQGTVIERELLLTLMGIQDPASLPETLSKDAALDEQVLPAILRDMDEIVFTPLHNAMRESGSAPPVEAPLEKPLEVPLPPRQQMPGHRRVPEGVIYNALPNMGAQVPAGGAPQGAPAASMPAQNVPPPVPARPNTSTPEVQPNTYKPAEKLETPPIPLQPKNGVPLVKEYAVDPYREPPEQY